MAVTTNCGHTSITATMLEIQLQSPTSCTKLERAAEAGHISFCANSFMITIWTVSACSCDTSFLPQLL